LKNNKKLKIGQKMLIQCNFWAMISNLSIKTGLNLDFTEIRNLDIKPKAVLNLKSGFQASFESGIRISKP